MGRVCVTIEILNKNHLIAICSILFFPFTIQLQLLKYTNKFNPYIFLCSVQNQTLKRGKK